MVVAPALITASNTRTRKSGLERDASSAENSTLLVYLAAWRTAATAISTTWSGSLRSLYCMCTGEVARKVWMRGFSATFTASQARSMSAGMARHRPATSTPFTARAMACTASKSPWLEAGNPASMMSTPRISNWRARRIFSLRFMVAPGDCSPSRRVVSKMRMRPDSMVMIRAPLAAVRARCGWGRDHGADARSSRAACAPDGLLHLFVSCAPARETGLWLRGGYTSARERRAFLIRRYGALLRQP